MRRRRLRPIAGSWRSSVSFRQFSRCWLRADRIATSQSRSDGAAHLPVASFRTRRGDSGSSQPRPTSARPRARRPSVRAEVRSCAYAGMQAPVRRAHLGASGCSMFVWLKLPVVRCWSWQAPFEIALRSIAPLFGDTRLVERTTQRPARESKLLGLICKALATLTIVSRLTFFSPRSIAP